MALPSMGSRVLSTATARCFTVNTRAPADRLRFNLAHEIGHVLMDTDKLPRRESEGLAQRFGSSFLVPPPIVKQELGERRHALSFDELGILKCKYGMSMAAWMYAAKAHGIISENGYRSLCVAFGRRGWKRREPVEYVGKETPVRLRQLTARALAEDLIDVEQAERLCPGIGKQPSAESGPSGSFTASSCARSRCTQGAGNAGSSRTAASRLRDQSRSDRFRSLWAGRPVR